MRRAVPASLALALCSHPAAAALPPCPVEMPSAEAVLYGDGDASRLLTYAAGDDDQSEGLLVRAEAASLLLQDGAALEQAQRYLADGTPARAHDAWSLIGVVHLRQGHYAEAARAFETALGLPPAVRQDGRNQSESLRKTLQIARVLSREPAPQPAGPVTGQLTVAPDAAGLVRGEVSVNGHPLQAVLDTGAGLSVVVESLVAALGLRLLEGEVRVASPVSAATPARLAIADRLDIAGAGHRNVVFLVMPDEALTFAVGAYRIEAIVGFQVLSRLGRLQFSPAGDAQVLSFRRTAARPRLPAEANLIVDGSTPKVLACAGSPLRPLQLALDSGASETSMLARYGEEFPDAMSDARQVTETIGGAGGTVEQEGLLLPYVEFEIAGRRVRLAEVSLGAETLDQPHDHGRLGQDVLSGGYVVDFETMRFELAPAAAQLPLPSKKPRP